MASPEKSLGKKTRTKKSKPKKSGKKIRHTHIEHGDDGSHVIRHIFDNQGQGPDDLPTPDAVHGVSDSDGLLQHMQGQFGGQIPGAESPGAGPAPAPAPAPQAGM
jgi:hypothetical protein